MINKKASRKREAFYYFEMSLKNYLLFLRSLLDPPLLEPDLLELGFLLGLRLMFLLGLRFGFLLIFLLPDLPSILLSLLSNLRSLLSNLLSLLSSLLSLLTRLLLPLSTVPLLLLITLLGGRFLLITLLPGLILGKYLLKPGKYLL